MLFIDIETSTPNLEKPDWSLDPRRNKIDLIGITGGNMPIDIFKERPLDYFTGYSDIGGHGFKFDYRTLHAKGYKLSIEQYRHDTLIMAAACTTKVSADYIEGYEKKRRELNAALPKGQAFRPAKKHSLKVLAPYFLSISPFWENPATTNDPEYLKKDVEYTRGLFDHFVPMLKKEGTWEFYNDRLMPWQRMLLTAEIQGIGIDIKAMAELKKQAEAGVLTSLKKLRAAWSKVEEEWNFKQHQELAESYGKMAQQAKEKAGLSFISKINAIETITPAEKIPKAKEKAIELHRKRLKSINTRYDELHSKATCKIEPFNYASNTQLLWAFKDVLHYPVINMEGEETTGASVLELLAAQGKEDIKALLEYKGNYKRAHSYFPSYAEAIVNGRINCSYNMFPRTGRLSCSNVNLQQVPPDLKKMFTPEPGNCFVSQDLSAIEVVLIAYYTEDEALCRIIMDGLDFHGVATVDFFELDIDPQAVKAKCPDMRYAAKQGDLSLFYGSGKNRLFTTLTLNGIKEIGGKPLTPELCSRMVYRFRDRFKEAWDFKKMLDAELLSGAAVANLFGRRFKVANPEDIYMTGLNTLIQGSASDLLLQGAHDCLKELHSDGIWAEPRLFVHDQFVVETRLADAEHVNARLIHHLTKFRLNTKHGVIPLKTEGGYGQHWK